VKPASLSDIKHNPLIFGKNVKNRESRLSVDISRTYKENAKADNIYYVNLKIGIP